MWVSIAIGQLNWPVELDLEELFFHKAMRSEDGSISSQFWPVEHGSRQDPTDLKLFFPFPHFLQISPHKAMRSEDRSISSQFWPVEHGSRQDPTD